MIDPTASIGEFADWWMKEKPFCPPKNAMRYLKDFSGVTLFREGQFQVQLFIGNQRAHAPRHSHPNIDSIDIRVAGLALFDSDHAEHDEKKTRIHIGPGEGHTATAGNSGGCFLSIQKWLNGVEPTSVELDWVGEPLDEDHETLIMKGNNNAIR